jgi:hypothetical protein
MKTKPKEIRTLFGITELTERWGLSRFTLMRAATRGDLRTVTIAGRVFIPRSEVERAETFGVGDGRKRWTKKAKAQ